MTQELAGPLDDIVTYGDARERTRVELLSRFTTIGYAVLARLAYDFLSWPMLPVLIACGTVELLLELTVLIPRRKQRFERVRAALRDAPDTIAEIVYRRSGKVVVTLGDGTRLVMRVGRPSVADAVAELSARCPNARVHEGDPAVPAFGPAPAKLLPPK